jgi:dihydrofolate reductase
MMRKDVTLMISIVVAMSKDNIIGFQNRLPWYLPADLKYFKQLTLNKTIVMGRKTFESIGKPLPQRENIIVSHQPLHLEGCKVISNLDQLPFDKEIMIIGGAQIYILALPLVNDLYITWVDGNFTGDTFFPKLDWKDWEQISIHSHLPDEKNLFSYHFTHYRRIR